MADLYAIEQKLLRQDIDTHLREEAAKKERQRNPDGLGGPAPGDYVPETPEQQEAARLQASKDRDEQGRAFFGMDRPKPEQEQEGTDLDRAGRAFFGLTPENN